ncbi:MAG: diaminopimelate epimerase [Candidatus Firestonebacteria bacterium]
MRNLRFAKLSGAGNDYLVMDHRRKVIRNPELLAKEVCDRRRSIGADGLLLLERSKNADFKMRIINPDGSEAQMCGNGIRCIGLFAFLKKIADKKMVVETLSGLKYIEIKDIKNYYVKVNMGKPSGLILSLKIKINSKIFNGYFVNTGVPHTVIFNDKVSVKEMGRKIRFHKLFKPNGTNVNFVKVLSKNKIKVRTYERGVEDETHACGTGSTASAYISSITNKINFPTFVITFGGDVLKIDIDKEKNLYMSGKVKYICEGILL